MPNATTAPPAVLLRNLERAARNLKGVIYKTPLLQNRSLSRLYDATVLLFLVECQPQTSNEELASHPRKCPGRTRRGHFFG